jgi:short-subunit dehydrogenase
MSELKGRTAVITGGASGIGAACAPGGSPRPAHTSPSPT